MLDAETHAEVAERIAADPALQRQAQFWQTRLSTMDGSFEEVTAPAGVLSKVEARLFGATADASPFAAFWSNIAVWRVIAAGGVAVAALLIGVNLMRPVQTGPAVAPTQLAATLEADQSNVKFLVLYDSASGDVRLSGLSGNQVPDRDFELWFIQGDNAPQSLGVVPVNGRVQVQLDAKMRASIGAGTVFAVTLEPKGGAPAGVPTGPIVAKGAVSII